MTIIQKFLFGSILGGLLFSGYMSGEKLFIDTCAFNTSCPYFLGYPACYTGFLLYLALFLVMILGLYKRKISEKMYISLNIISFVGVLFSGKFSVPEIQLLMQDGFKPFFQSIPLCTIGFLFFVSIFVLGVAGESRCKDGLYE